MISDFQTQYDLLFYGSDFLSTSSSTMENKQIWKSPNELSYNCPHDDVLNNLESAN